MKETACGGLARVGLENVESRQESLKSVWIRIAISANIENPDNNPDKVSGYRSPRGLTRASSQKSRHTNLELALHKARERFERKWPGEEVRSTVVFNVQTPSTEPLLCVADYLCWSVQRVFERGEMRHYEYVMDKVSLVIDLYDMAKYEGGRNYYTRERPLTAQNKLSPPLP